MLDGHSFCVIECVMKHISARTSFRSYDWLLVVIKHFNNIFCILVSFLSKTLQFIDDLVIGVFIDTFSDVMPHKFWYA